MTMRNVSGRAGENRNSFPFSLIICLALFLVASKSHGNTTGGYIAHEWGTFTSLQAPDGTLLSWNAGAPTDLPAFVYNWKTPGPGRAPAGVLAFNKGTSALQRMETPVVYLYGKERQSIDLTVRFPKGTITEWYPHALDIGPSSTRIEGTDESALTRTNLESMIRWRTEILSRAEGARVRLPVEKSENHYFAARETEAATLLVNGPSPAAKSEFEKFLFYRGIGNFATPLKVTGQGTGITVSNTGDQPLKHLFIYTVQDGRGQFQALKQLAAGEEKTFGSESRKFVPLNKLVTQISREMVTGLVAEGLYEAEAKAMVKTWRSSWFEEEGVRVLYMLPEKWTEEVLPMTLDPQPRELVRVMVGRAELIRPDTERELIGLLAQAKDPRQDVNGEIKKLLKPYGRFGQPILHRALHQVDPMSQHPELVKLYSIMPQLN